MASRKNHTLKLAGILLALVLVTSCFVGGTFAKYVTKGTGSDSARVAKFGVTVTANGTMFAKEYDTGTENVKGTIAKSVVSDGTDDKNLVAPGTSGNMVSMTLAGKPEVAVNVTYNAENFILKGNWLGDANTFYCPLIITVGDTVIKCAEKTSADDVKTAVQAAVAACSANYGAKTDLSTVANGGLKISWEWPFEGGATNPNQTDVKDTYLGNQATKPATPEILPSIYIPVTATVTQID